MSDRLEWFLASDDGCTFFPLAAVAPDMVCPECDGDRVRVDVPADLREFAPADADAVVVCTNCLRTWPPSGAPDEPAGEPGAASGALPADETAAVAVLLAASLLSSVAHNADALSSLFDRIERSGADPRLILERLADDPGLDPAVDLRRRLRQFEGLR